MYFDGLNKILEISSQNDSSIFVMPDSIGVKIKNAIEIMPDEKTTITVEQIREMISMVSTKQTEDRYIIIRPADKMSDVAANAFLKSLEEPNGKVHYILITAHPSRLLPTILSRAAIYFLREKWDCRKIEGDEKEKILAKRLMTAKGRDLVVIAEEIGAKKNGVREYALRIVGLAIEILYKSYLMTEKEIFVKKIPKFLKLYENLERNGHIKLHIVADLC